MALTPRRRMPVRRHSLITLLLLALTVPVGSAASADDSDPTLGGPVFPSQQQVDAGKAKVRDTAGRVGAIEAELAAASARADRLAAQAAQAVEAYNGARVRLDRATQVAAKAQQAAQDARARVRDARTELGRFAAAAYRSGGDLGGLATFLVAEGPRDMISRAAALQSIGNSRRAALERLRSSTAYAAVLQHRADALVVRRARAARAVERAKNVAQAQFDAQRQAVAEAAVRRDHLVRELAAARHTTVRLERARQDGLERQAAEAARRAAERAAAEAARRAEEARQAAAAKAAEDARRAAAEQAARQAEEKRRADAAASEQARQAEEKRQADAAAAAASSSPSGGGPGSSKPPGSSNGPGEPAPPQPDPPTGGDSQGTAAGAQSAIAYARAQIGKPYQWGADGPSSFDCSGLTMRAWAQGGVSLPHYSVAQYAESEKVAITDVRPGDLVFFGSGPDYHSIYHVGLYIGDGQMIEAPYTGEDVRISSIWRSSLFGAARP
jgi:cell wall-associated NlpC family hydrolase